MGKIPALLFYCSGIENQVFQGASSLSLDAKGRLSVPTRHREVLSATAGGQLTITKHPHGCLMMFPRTEWERFRERKLLKKIEQSIQRIDSGDYGYCDETGEPIGVGRLLARPTANLSLEAQQRRELKQKMFGD